MDQEVLKNRLIDQILATVVLSQDKKPPQKQVQRTPKPQLEQLLADSPRSVPKKVSRTMSRTETHAHKKTKVSYKLFIPAKVNYDAVSLSYKKDEEEELAIEVKDDGVQLVSTKPNTSTDAYGLQLTYDPAQEGYHVLYQTEEYADQIQKARDDFTSRLDKFLEIMPKSLMGGVLGFTYLGSGKMARRDDLFGDMAMLVDVHEAIHTPDEYETRVLTDWMLKKEAPRYKK